MTLFAQEVMTPIKLSGSLAKMFGRDHQRLVGSSGEVIKALCVTIPGFEQYLMTAKQRGLTFAVFKIREMSARMSWSLQVVDKKFVLFL